jgi:DNA primase catalytic subunit
MATLKELLGDGYNENLTHAEIDNLIKDKKFADLTTGEYVSLGKYKALENEKNDLNTKYLAKLTDEEKREAEIAEREKYFEQLERTNNINEYAKKLSRITDEKTRLEIAELLADGKTFEAIEKQNEYQANKETQLRETIKQELLSSNPTPPPVNNTGTKTKEQIMNISDPFERQREIEQNIDLFM